MSGLSMTDMRRIGERRNTERLTAEPSRNGFLPKLNVSLPFSGRSTSGHTDPGRTRPDVTPPPVASNQAVDRLSRLQSGPSPSLPEAHLTSSQPPALVAEPITNTTPSALAAPVGVDPFAEAPVQLSGMTAKQAAAPLRSGTGIKASIGAGFGAAVGFAASGTLIALPAGLVVGGIGGLALAKRGQATVATTRGKKVAIKRSQAEPLFAAFEDICVPFAINTPKFTITVNQSAALQVSSSGKPTNRKLDLTIGLALLSGLSIEQLQALFAQCLGRLLAEEMTSSAAVEANIVASLDQLHTKKAKRGQNAKQGTKASTNFQAFTQHLQSAQFAWSAAASGFDRQADNRAAAIVGSAALVDAILAQGLIAQRFCDDDEALTYQDRLQALRSGYSQSDLNQALQGLAAAKTDAQSYLGGLPLQLLDRITALDTSIPVPSIPASQPAFGSLNDRPQALLDKKLAGIKADKANAKSAKVKTAKPKKQKQTKAASSVKKPKTQKTSIFARFKSKKAAPDLADMTTSTEPLYDADNLFKTDAGVGLEAYQSLVDAHPRWALARLRLAEAQIECGLGDGVANLMMAAEQLPSAMPTILATLQGALPMVSPLEEEPLRQVIERMWSDADAMSAERAQIDLARLEAPRMDASDMATLSNLFANAHGLREAWVFNVPCVYVPEVPHHAILGLAPRLPDEDSEILAMQLAEHAAILGTVAVHIETGTPRGGLGDALASQPSLWRAGMA